MKNKTPKGARSNRGYLGRGRGSMEETQGRMDKTFARTRAFAVAIRRVKAAKLKV